MVIKWPYMILYHNIWFFNYVWCDLGKPTTWWNLTYYRFWEQLKLGSSPFQICFYFFYRLSVTKVMVIWSWLIAITFRNFYLFDFFLDYVSHSGYAHVMTISDPSMLSKWENLQNIRLFKHLFSSLYIYIYIYIHRMMTCYNWFAVMRKDFVLKNNLSEAFNLIWFIALLIKIKL